MNNKFRLFTSICLITGILSISFSGSAANNLSSDWSSNSRLTLTEGEKLNAHLDEKKQKQLKELNEQLEKDPRVFIKYKDSANLSNAGQKIATKLNIYNYNYKKVSTFGDLNAETITFDTKENMYKAIEQLKSDEYIEYIEPDYMPIDLSSITVITSDEPHFSKQWGLSNSGQSVNGTSGTANIDIAASGAWSILSNNTTVTVGIIDTGIDISHSDLSGNIYVNSLEVAGDNIDNDGNGYIDDVNGWDFFNNDKTVYDTGENSHATHVAGIIAAQDNTIGIVGVAPKAKIMPLKITTQSAEITSGTAIINALDYAHSKGVRIVNCSWGIGAFNPNFSGTINTIIEKMTTTYSDTLYVCAAGNNGTSLSILTVPAGYSYKPNIIAVGAADSNGNLASWSNYGEYVSIAAPGVNIYSTLPSNSYGFLDGTSQAAPFVTGIAALLLANASFLTSSNLKTYIVDNRGRTLPQLSGKVGSSKFATATPVQ